MVFAGGGSRLAYYLGLHAAACEAGHAPDVLLASCGGAWAAAVLHRLPDPHQAKAWMMGPQAHEFICSIRANPAQAWPTALRRAAVRWLDRSSASRVPDVWSAALFRVDRPVALPPAAATAGPAVALVGARVMLPRDQAGQLRAGRVLFEETVFAEPSVAARLAGSPCALAPTTPTLAATIATRTDITLEDAVRISITDLHYLEAPAVRGDHWVGGFVDLMPLELARLLAGRITAEKKPAFDTLLASPALRHGIGLDVARRWREVHAQPVDWRVDTSDMQRAVPPLMARRWGRHGLTFKVPTPAEFAQRVSLQWDYGFARGRAAYQRQGQGQGREERGR